MRGQTLAPLSVFHTNLSPLVPNIKPTITTFMSVSDLRIYLAFNTV